MGGSYQRPPKSRMGLDSPGAGRSRRGFWSARPRGATAGRDRVPGRPNRPEGPPDEKRPPRWGGRLAIGSVSVGQAASRRRRASPRPARPKPNRATVPGAGMAREPSVKSAWVAMSLIICCPRAEGVVPETVFMMKSIS